MINGLDTCCGASGDVSASQCDSPSEDFVVHNKAAHSSVQLKGSLINRIRSRVIHRCVYRAREAAPEAAAPLWNGK